MDILATTIVYQCSIFKNFILSRTSIGLKLQSWGSLSRETLLKIQDIAFFKKKNESLNNFSVITMALFVEIAQRELKLWSARHNCFHRIKRIRQCFIIHMVEATLGRLETIQDEIDKIKFKRIFQRKPYFVWATQVIIGNPYW